MGLGSHLAEFASWLFYAFQEVAEGDSALNVAYQMLSVWGWPSVALVRRLEWSLPTGRAAHRPEFRLDGRSAEAFPEVAALLACDPDQRATAEGFLSGLPKDQSVS